MLTQKRKQSNQKETVLPYMDIFRGHRILLLLKDAACSAENYQFGFFSVFSLNQLGNETRSEII